MKILALDSGDVWIGSALSDALFISAKPYKTIEHSALFEFLNTLFASEAIRTVIIGCPTTLSGTESAQTKKAIALKETLEEKYPTITWILWDERLSSKRAENAFKEKKMTKEEKTHSHSIAAAYILQSYLDYKAIHSPL